MTLATKMANAGANILSAVPLMVWLAFILMDAYAWKKAKAAPVAVEIRMARASWNCPPIFPPVMFKNRIPVNAPMVMMPSRAMFTTPLRSENMPPSATIIRGMVNSMVCWKIKYTTLMTGRLLSPCSYSHGSGWSSQSMQRR